MMVVVILLVFTIPLVCWALLARSARSGDRVGAILTCCVLAETAAAKQWVFGTARVTLITALSMLTVVILIWGAVQEHRPGGGWALDRERVCTWLDDLTELPLVVVYVETGNGT